MSAPALHLLSVAETAETLRCSRRHIYNLIGRGELSAVDISDGRRPKTRIRSDHLHDYIDRQTRRLSRSA